MSASALQAARDAGPSAATLVLHVLAGPNGGAELRLHDGEWLVGAGDSADITFAEPALAENHLRIVVDGPRISVVALAAGARAATQDIPVDTPTPLLPLVPIWIGATAFALGPSGSAWPNVTSLPVLATVATPAANATVTATQDQERQPLSPPLALVRTRPRKWFWAGLGAGCVVIALIGVIWVIDSTAMPPNPPGPPPTDRLMAAQEVITTLGLEQRVVASRNKGLVSLSGVVSSEAQQNALTAGLQRAGVAADINVITEAHLRDMALTVLRGFDLDPVVTATGNGQVRLTGYANATQTVTAAVQQLRQDVPWIKAVEDAVVTPDRARAQLEADLREAGLAGLKISSAPHAVTVTGALAADRLATWSSVVEKFRSQFPPGVIQLTAQILPQAVAAPRGVSLGRNPYIVTEDGKQLGIGDQLGSLGRIVAIFADKLRVRAATGDADVRYSQPPNWIMEDTNAQP
jgi:type III secretion system YscD/HrpQ family protein